MPLSDREQLPLLPHLSHSHREAARQPQIEPKVRFGKIVPATSEDKWTRDEPVVASTINARHT